MSTRSPDHRDDQIAWTETPDIASDFDHLRERLVAENQTIRSLGRTAVLKRNDFPVSATEADLANAEQHVGRALKLWFRYFDELNTLLRRKNSQRLHGGTPKTCGSSGGVSSHNADWHGHLVDRRTRSFPLQDADGLFRCVPP